VLYKEARMPTGFARRMLALGGLLALAVAAALPGAAGGAAQPSPARSRTGA
jgi:hypothetical protein